MSNCYTHYTYVCMYMYIYPVWGSGVVEAWVEAGVRLRVESEATQSVSGPTHSGSGQPPTSSPHTPLHTADSLLSCLHTAPSDIQSPPPLLSASLSVSSLTVAWC